MSLYRSLALSFIVAVVLYGCATERPVEPEAMVEMPAMELTIDPIREVSDWIEPVQTTNANIFTFFIEDAEKLRSGYFTDIHLGYESRLCPRTFDTYVLKPTSNSWEQIEWYRKPDGQGCSFNPFAWHYYRFLSSALSAPVAQYLDDRDFLTIRCDSVLSARVSLIRYNDSYVRQFIGCVSPVTSYTLSSDGDNLWANVSCVDDDNNIFDSVLIYNKAGQRVDQYATPNYHTFGACFDNAGRMWKWVLSTGQFVAFDRTGTGVDSIAVQDAVRGNIDWYDNRIWFFSGPFGISELVAVNVAASADSGYAVIDRRYAQTKDQPFHTDFIMGFSVDNNLVTVNDGARIYQMSLVGDVLEAYPAPVRLPFGLVIDNETAWVLHQGPLGVPRFRTNELFLSRFKLPWDRHEY